MSIIVSLPRVLLCFFIGASLLASSGCVRSYRVEIQQGNVISAEQIEKITPGTPRNEVRFILGTPLIEDPFHAQRWDYFYSDTLCRIIEECVVSRISRSSSIRGIERIFYGRESRHE